MNLKGKLFIKNFSYTIAANFSSLLISVFVVLLIPKLIGIEEYGYLQLYLFYSSYIGFFQFGWNDGIYLRYGGAEYKLLDKKIFFSQFWMLVSSQILIAFIIVILTLFSSNETDKQFVLFMVALCTVIMGTRAMLVFILQATNRIKEYSQIIIVDRILYCFFILAVLLIGARNYEFLISADLLGKCISLLYAMFYCKEIVFQKLKSFKFSMKETLKNINVGIKLMLANIASMLIIGTVRFGIERSWGISTFGKVSLTLSISNLMMLFINAVGIIMFPILRRTNKDKLPSIYETMRDFLMIILLGALITYYPLYVLLSSWLPRYEESLLYMGLLLPMFVFEGKMALLINTYLKTLRKEKLMLRINLISFTLSLIFTFLSTILFKNLTLAIVSIVILLAFRSVMAEFFLMKILSISVYKDVLLELILMLIFILTGWFINSWITMPLYGVAYLMYLLIKKKDITLTIKNIKSLMKT